jgi:lipoyl(octanoyl) transferase
LIQLLVAHIGRTRYADAWKLQQKVWEMRRVKKIGDILLLTEHEHVYTIGKSGDDNHLLASKEELLVDGVDVHHIDRGGDITYHGPGQIVGYPILDLNNFQPDIHLYLRNLEEVLLQTLTEFGIRGTREEGFTGVWVDGEKIAAIGVKVSRWVTMHGFALNVNTDLEKFGRIIPCGIFHKGVTSMKTLLGRELPLMDVEKTIARKFAQIYGCIPHTLVHDQFLELTMEQAVENNS